MTQIEIKNHFESFVNVFKLTDAFSSLSSGHWLQPHDMTLMKGWGYECMMMAFVITVGDSGVHSSYFKTPVLRAYSAHSYQL